MEVPVEEEKFHVIHDEIGAFRIRFLGIHRVILIIMVRVGGRCRIRRSGRGTMTVRAGGPRTTTTTTTTVTTTAHRLTFPTTHITTFPLRIEGNARIMDIPPVLVDIHGDIPLDDIGEIVDGCADAEGDTVGGGVEDGLGVLKDIE